MATVKSCETCNMNEYCKDKVWYKWAGGAGAGCWHPIGSIRITQECDHEENSVTI